MPKKAVFENPNRPGNVPSSVPLNFTVGLLAAQCNTQTGNTPRAYVTNFGHNLDVWTYHAHDT
jgi:hypothetical protein